MAKYLFVYRGAPDAEAKMPPEQMQQVMQKWGAWIGEAMQKGWMVDPGDALLPEGRVVRGKVVKDGPFVESKEVVGGYSVVEAPTIDAAAELAKGCPGLLYGGAVEVRTLAGLAAQL
ncbi:MAG TPA: YciI family protein [Planctomycetaceae bacterium]|nr:YciI family protein [Planctomycetaceae bacterium]